MSGRLGSGTRSAGAAPPANGFGRSTLDVERMCRERHGRLVSAMAEQGLDALLLTYPPNVAYATGASGPPADPSHCYLVPTVALVTADGEVPHLFAPETTPVPPHLPADHVGPPFAIDTAEGAAELAKAVGDIIGGSARLGIDELTGSMAQLQPGAFGAEQIDDPSLVIVQARVCKTPDEIECIYRAQFLNELAMYDVQAELRPGMRQCDLSALFLRRICEFGTASVLDPIWQVTPRSREGGPSSSNGELPFPTPPSDQILRRGDLLLVDTGITYEGYASDFGRTWVVGETEVLERERGYFEAWREVMSRVLGVVQPGATGADLTAAACLGGKAKPWLAHFYLGHGVGLESAEMPLVGTDLGPDFDASLVMAPGMVLVLEPVIWEDGYGGYRGEEIVAVTDGGYEMLTRYPYDPFFSGGAPWW